MKNKTQENNSAKGSSIFVAITSKEKNEKPVSPLIYGNFIELGLGRQIEGLWAELLNNPSFEEVPPYKKYMWEWMRRTPADDLRKEDWWHSAYEENRWYLKSDSPTAKLYYDRYWDFHHGRQSAVVNNTAGKETAYLAQDRIFIKKNVPHVCQGFIRTGEMGGSSAQTVTTALSLYPDTDFAKPIASANVETDGTGWTEFKVEFPPIDHSCWVTFAVSIGPGLLLHADGFSLMPADNINGWRKETIEAVKRVRPRILRFPGGCFASFYNWRDGIGAPRDRMPKESEYWGGLEQNFVGTNEFIDLCRRTDAEPFLCVNVMTGTEDDAADWVAYCNAPQTHRVAMHRARSGSKEPFAVKYWELDNETFRKYDAIEYANRCVAFSKAMKAVDPSIKLVMVGYWRFRELLPQMLEIAGPHIDLVTDRAMDENYWHPLMKVVADYNAKTGRNIQLCNTEWLAPDEGVSVVPDGLNRSPLPADITFQNKAIRWHYAMNAAKQLLVFQRLGGDFVFSNFNNLANTWGQNVMECPKEAVFLSAAGRVFELLSVSPAAWILESSSTDETGKTEVQAAWNLDRNALTMTIVNYLDRKIAFNLDFRQLNFKPTRANVSTLFAESLASFNAVGAPDTIQREDSTQILDDFGKYTTDAPPYSVTHVVLE